MAESKKIIDNDDDDYNNDDDDEYDNDDEYEYEDGDDDGDDDDSYDGAKLQYLALLSSNTIYLYHISEHQTSNIFHPTSLK